VSGEPPATEKDNPTKLERDAVINWFGGKAGYLEYHNSQHTISDIEDRF